MAELTELMRCRFTDQKLHATKTEHKDKLYYIHISYATISN